MARKPSGNKARSPISEWYRKTRIWLGLALIMIAVVVASFLCCYLFDTDHGPLRYEGGPSAATQEYQQQKEERRKERWEEYKIHIDLFKYYLELVLRTNLAFFAITGAIITFYFKNREENKYLKKALLLPIFMSQALAGFYFYGGCLWGKVSDTVNALREELGIVRTPDIHILTVLLALFGGVFLVTGEAMLWFLWTDKFESNKVNSQARTSAREKAAAPDARDDNA